MKEQIRHVSISLTNSEELKRSWATIWINRGISSDKQTARCYDADTLLRHKRAAFLLYAFKEKYGCMG